MLKIFCLKDDKHGRFLRPFFATHAGEAYRSITMELRKSQSMLSQFPGDFSLWEFGEWSEESGLFSLPGAQHLCNLVALMDAPGKEGENA